MIGATDIFVLLGLLGNEQRTIRELAARLGISKSNVAYSLGRLAEARLLAGHRGARRLVRLAVRDLLVHGAQYLFPPRLDGFQLGLPTAYSHPSIAGQLFAAGETVVMPLAEGPVRGRVLEPIHPQAPRAAAGDDRLHEVLALVDALRVGRARERRLAADLLRERI
jgi:DNA-binding transcriptional ArsR family regulator